MKVALVYAPPWKIPEQGQAPDAKDGPPGGYAPGDLDADFYQTPYGLFALGAQALRAGHQVKVLNLSAFAWPRVVDVVGKLDADVFGLSCWTANRRGVALVAEEIERAHPGALVVVGGPHATPLAEELLSHHAAIDVVCRGESDVTFLELLERFAAKQPLAGVAGAVVRENGNLTRGVERPQIKDLDTLACPQDVFDTHILMTSRGCPWACTFCGAETSWGRGFRANSIPYVVHAMEAMVKRLPVKMVQIKDDTFTTNKKRVVNLCREIRARKLQFLWSCDTRVDMLDDELLREMRLAGCERLSLGVESGSQRILDAIDKKITVAEIEETARAAKRHGIRVRFYMMLGNRGETRESFEETLRFLERARPHEFIFSCLSIYPGTRDFADAEKAGWLDREAFFRERFQEMKTPFDASDADTELMNRWFSQNKGLRRLHKDTLAEREETLALLGEHHAAHMDVAAARYEAGDLDGAERHVLRALELDYPCPGLAYNHLACFAKARGDLDGMMNHFTTASKVDPQHYVLIQNVQAARAWFKADGPGKKLPLDLTVSHDFQLLERTVQPTLPGPLSDDFAVWAPPLAPPEPAAVYVKTPDVEGSGKGLEPKTRLRIVPS